MNKLQLENLSYRYAKKSRLILKDVNLTFTEGTITAIVGESGAGKSTLLHLIAGLIKAEKGSILFNGEKVTDPAAYRRNICSMISQSYLLFPYRTVFENAEYPLQMKKIKYTRNAVEEALSSVNLPSELYGRLPSTLSGGEQQRVAIARCLLSDSDIIVADEPTGNLDVHNTQEIISLLLNIAHQKKKIIIIVTHDPEVAAQADTCYELSYGNIRPYTLHH
ncbi:MAG: ABC transporter ATP-binding protein [Erysipelotrichaceae bacterium]|nr:ABC transporter ATP-binding protein [Erysipelotrichaceae bacterium]